MTNTVWYVPVPETGTVYAGAGTVLKFLTRGIPVPNPRWCVALPSSSPAAEGVVRLNKKEKKRRRLTYAAVIALIIALPVVVVVVVWCPPAVVATGGGGGGGDVVPPRRRRPLLREW